MPDAAQKSIAGRENGERARRTEYVRREDGAIVFRCDVCARDIHDLRSVFLAHRAGGWRIECSSHPETEYEVDAGRLFGGGLHALEVFADLARARWFDPADLFRTFLRLRAQASGLYLGSAAPGHSGD